MVEYHVTFSNDLAATTMDFASAQQLLGPGFMSTPPQPPVVPTMPMMQPPPMMAAPPPTSASSSSSNNSLKKGPQVLIKNVNGKVVITPIAETQTATKRVSPFTIPPCTLVRAVLYSNTLLLYV